MILLEVMNVLYYFVVYSHYSHFFLFRHMELSHIVVVVNGAFHGIPVSFCCVRV